MKKLIMITILLTGNVQAMTYQTDGMFSKKGECATDYVFGFGCEVPNPSVTMKNYLIKEEALTDAEIQDAVIEYCNLQEDSTTNPDEVLCGYVREWEKTN